MSILSVGDSHRYEICFSQDDVRKFMDLSGDRNIIHYDETAAERSPIGIIAIPGVLAEGRISEVHGTQFPGHGTVYRSKNVKFRKPMRVGVEYAIIATVRRVVRSAHYAELSTIVVDKASGVTMIEGSYFVLNNDRI